jgi:AcrR family transcriptional regulator
MRGSPVSPALERSGLRERKKQRMREHIAQVARSLFAARGFEAVTVAEVARVAEVAEQTVYNYFPRKEDLVYWRLESFEDELLATIRERATGESALAAFGEFVRAPRGLLAKQDPGTREQLAALTRMITESPALLAREQQIFARYTAALAALLAEEQGADSRDVEAWVAANALMGVHRALVDFARRRIVEGARGAGLRRDVLARADQALALLEDGLRGYAVKE